MVHMCKSTISSGVFLCIFQIVIIGVNSGVKGQKNDANWQKIMCVALHVLGSIHHMIVIFGTHV